jgi:hypothetical protein
MGQTHINDFFFLIKLLLLLLVVQRRRNKQSEHDAQLDRGSSRSTKKAAHTKNIE